MTRKLGFLSLVLVALLTLAAPVGAQGPITPSHTDPAWQAYYWNNTSLSGDPALIRSEANICRNWDISTRVVKITSTSIAGCKRPNVSRRLR